jgi:hypothetical protein
MGKKRDKRVYNKSLAEKLEDSEIEFNAQKNKKRQRLVRKEQDRRK